MRRRRRRDHLGPCDLCAGREVEEEGREGGKKSDDEPKNEKNDDESTEDRDKDDIYVKRTANEDEDMEGNSIG